MHGQAEVTCQMSKHVREEDRKEEDSFVRVQSLETMEVQDSCLLYGSLKNVYGNTVTILDLSHCWLTYYGCCENHCICKALEIHQIK